MSYRNTGIPEFEAIERMLATSDERGTTPMNDSILAGGERGAIFSNAPTSKSACVPLESSNPIGLPYGSPPVLSHESYEIRRSLPMKQCAFCQQVEFVGGKRRIPRRTSWIYRKKGWTLWYRVCFGHMTIGMRKVIEEMYSR